MSARRAVYQPVGMRPTGPSRSDERSGRNAAQAAETTDALRRQPALPAMNPCRRSATTRSGSDRGRTFQNRDDEGINEQVPCGGTVGRRSGFEFSV